MSKAYTVAQAFQATVSKEDKTPKTVTFNGHTFNAWKVKLVDQEEYGVEGKEWLNVNKKPGNEIKPGDELYGDIEAINGKFGTFHNFKSASRPMGDSPSSPSQPAAPVESTSTVSTELMHDKLDYIIELLEKLGVEPATKPVDLEDLDI